MIHIETERWAVLRGKVCGYCEGKPSLVDSSKVYKKSYGNIWLCECGARVGVHKQSNEPLGRLADKELRGFKKLAHAAFDPMWDCRVTGSRKKAYAWLANEMGMTKDRCHIGMMDVEQCKWIIDLCKEQKNEIR